jgi:myo-inositol 2-dehydrogenase / D-chiro-inositol 1-dehydrogenase
MCDEACNYGFPQEMARFLDCVLNDKQPLETGEDGRVVLEIIFAAYERAPGTAYSLLLRAAILQPVSSGRGYT